MRSMRGIVSALVLLVAIAAAFWQKEAARGPGTAPAPTTDRAPENQAREPGDPANPSGSGDRSSGGEPRPSATRSGRGEIGFRSHERLVEHYQKHGREFGAITQDEYLRRAQDLRDRPAGGDVLEAVRADGVITRFDRASGAFLAANPDRTIRTFFRPNQGETYFRRQRARRN